MSVRTLRPFKAQRGDLFRGFKTVRSSAVKKYAADILRHIESLWNEIPMEI